MFDALREVFERYSTAELTADLETARIPCSMVHDIYQVAKLEAIRSKLTRTHMPDGTPLQLQPLPVDLPGGPRELSFAPGYGEHSRSILREMGLDDRNIDELEQAGVVRTA